MLGRGRRRGVFRGGWIGPHLRRMRWLVGRVLLLVVVVVVVVVVGRRWRWKKAVVFRYYYVLAGW